jgi:hypothetical protein
MNYIYLKGAIMKKELSNHSFDKTTTTTTTTIVACEDANKKT